MAVSWVREREGLIKFRLGREKAVYDSRKKAKKMKRNCILGGISNIVPDNQN